MSLNNKLKSNQKWLLFFILKYLYKNNIMNYYINKNKLLITDADLSLTNRVSSDFNESYESFVQLNDEQITFYESNQNASVREIFLMRLDIVIEPTLDELKSTKRKQIEESYTSLYSDNFDVVLTPMVLDGWKLGLPKCSETTMWVLQTSAERDNRINTVLGAIDKETINSVPTIPSQMTKPYESSDLKAEYFIGMLSNN